MDIVAEARLRLPEFEKKWMAVGLSTEPADRPRAECGIIAAYMAAGLRPPERIIWCDSPMAGTLSRGTYVHTYREKSVQLEVWDQPTSAIETAIREGLIEEKKREKKVDEVWKIAWTLRTRIHAVIRAQILASIQVAIRNDLATSHRGYWYVPLAVASSLQHAISGQHAAARLAFWDFLQSFSRPCPENALLTAQIDIAQSAGWFWPHQHICWICEQPRTLRLDAEQRLHCADGPAVTYADKFKIYAWHGIPVPKYVILHPERITAEAIQACTNIEVRRVMIERYGQERYLLDSGAQVVHEDRYGTLYRAPLRDDEPLTMVKVANATPEPDGTRKDYFIRVPPTMQTAHEAVAWTFEMRPKDYHPKLET